jgi:hypothetical protein
MFWDPEMEEKNDSQMKEIADEDWAVDCAGQSTINYNHFVVAMFKLCDVWTDFIDGESYLDFLVALRDRMTSLSVVDGEVRRVLRSNRKGVKRGAAVTQHDKVTLIVKSMYSANERRWSHNPQLGLWLSRGTNEDILKDRTPEAITKMVIRYLERDCKSVKELWEDAVKDCKASLHELEKRMRREGKSRTAVEQTAKRRWNKMVDKVKAHGGKEPANVSNTFVLQARETNLRQKHTRKHLAMGAAKVADENRAKWIESLDDREGGGANQMHRSNTKRKMLAAALQRKQLTIKQQELSKRKGFASLFKAQEKRMGDGDSPTNGSKRTRKKSTLGKERPKGEERPQPKSGNVGAGTNGIEITNNGESQKGTPERAGQVAVVQVELPRVQWQGDTPQPVEQQKGEQQQQEGQQLQQLQQQGEEEEEEELQQLQQQEEVHSTRQQSPSSQCWQSDDAAPTPEAAPAAPSRAGSPSSMILKSRGESVGNDGLGGDLGSLAPGGSSSSSSSNSLLLVFDEPPCMSAEPKSLAYLSHNIHASSVGYGRHKSNFHTSQRNAARRIRKKLYTSSAGSAGGSSASSSGAAANGLMAVIPRSRAAIQCMHPREMDRNGRNGNMAQCISASASDLSGPMNRSRWCRRPQREMQALVLLKQVRETGRQGEERERAPPPNYLPAPNDGSESPRTSSSQIGLGLSSKLRSMLQTYDGTEGVTTVSLSQDSKLTPHDPISNMVYQLRGHGLLDGNITAAIAPSNALRSGQKLEPLRDPLRDPSRQPLSSSARGRRDVSPASLVNPPERPEMDLRVAYSFSTHGPNKSRPTSPMKSRPTSPTKSRPNSGRSGSRPSSPTKKTYMYPAGNGRWSPSHSGSWMVK